MNFKVGAIVKFNKDGRREFFASPTPHGEWEYSASWYAKEGVKYRITRIRKEGRCDVSTLEIGPRYGLVDEGSHKEYASWVELPLNWFEAAITKKRNLPEWWEFPSEKA